MDLAKKGFQFPKKIDFDEETLSDFYGKLVAEPLERGFGTTLGNALRRVLLSSLEGAAVTGLRVGGVYHEFTSIDGVKEDVLDIVLNIKKLRFRVYGDGPRTVHIKVQGHKAVTGADVQTDASVEVMNQDQYIATVDNGATLDMEMYVKKGKGYVLAENNKEEGAPIDVLPVDAVFSPIRKVNFRIEKARVGRATDYDRMVMEVWTDGTITPEAAVSDAASILMDHLDLFIFVEREDDLQGSSSGANLISVNPNLNDNLRKNIDELELSVRAYNCLKNANIRTIADLVQKTEHEMLRTKNFGRKSLSEIKEILRKMGLQFGVRFDTEAGDSVGSQRGGAADNAS